MSYVLVGMVDIMHKYRSWSPDKVSLKGVKMRREGKCALLLHNYTEVLIYSNVTHTCQFQDSISNVWSGERLRRKHNNNYIEGISVLVVGTVKTCFDCMCIGKYFLN